MIQVLIFVKLSCQIEQFKDNNEVKRPVTMNSSNSSVKILKTKRITSRWIIDKSWYRSHHKFKQHHNERELLSTAGSCYLTSQ